jgi:type II secretory pathway pseudopilin PulG
MAYIPPIQAQQQGQSLTDEQQAQAALEAINQQIQGLGGQAPAPMGPPGFLERLFNSGAGEPTFQPMGIASGFLQGLAGGLASRGQKVAQKRQQVEALIESQRQAQNQQQLQDLQARRAAALKELSDVRSEHRAAVREANNPQLAAVMGPNGKPIYVRRNEALGKQPAEQQSGEPLMLIAGPGGVPTFVTRATALGQSPPQPELKPKPPSAAERDQLVGDIGTLKQVNDIREAFKPKFAGPASGRIGAITQAAGVFKRPGESQLRSRLAGMRNQILKLRSGGAVSDGEAGRLLEELPTTLDPSDVFLTKLDQFESTYRTIANARRDVMSGTGVDVSRIPDLPAKQGAGSGDVQVAAPNGKTYTFKSQKQADAFKQSAGIP